MLSVLKKLFLYESALTRPMVRLLAGPGPLTMLLLVRDEADIIQQNLDFHLRQGIETFVVTDNGSVDGTRQILREYERRLGRSFVVLDDLGSAHWQAERVNRMISLAKQRFRPRWIVSADADEFWFPVSGRYDTEFDGRGNALQCYWQNFLPRPDTLWQSFTDIGEMPGYHARMSKAVCVARGLFGMYPGNHQARIIPHVAVRSENIRVYHYPVRSYPQFERKVVQGHLAANRTAGPSYASWHWHAYYAAWQEGRLPELYKDLAASNGISTDTTMAEVFRYGVETPGNALLWGRV